MKKIRPLALAVATAALALGAASSALADSSTEAEVGPCSAQPSGVRFTNSGVNGTSKVQNCNRSATVKVRFVIHHVVAFIPWDTRTTCTLLKPAGSITFSNVNVTNNYVNAERYEYC